MNRGTVARAGATPSARVTSHACDVSVEAQVLRFRDEVLQQHSAAHVDLVFSNAGIGGGASFVRDSREAWERTFAIDWWGVYYCARAFLPKGFTEVLIEDLRINAPQVRVAVVMPGHVDTDIIATSRRALGLPEPEAMSQEQLEALILARARDGLIRVGWVPADPSADDLRQALTRIETDFREKAPLSPAQGATIILDGVRAGAWRVLVGRDAGMLDAAVGAGPEAACDYADLFGRIGATRATSRAERGIAMRADRWPVLVRAHDPDPRAAVTGPARAGSPVRARWPRRVPRLASRSAGPS
jgi:short-subunit dehydrogenase